jgi:hypothetical protein
LGSEDKVNKEKKKQEEEEEEEKAYSKQRQ